MGAGKEAAAPMLAETKLGSTPEVVVAAAPAAVAEPAKPSGKGGGGCTNKIDWSEKKEERNVNVLCAEMRDYIKSSVWLHTSTYCEKTSMHVAYCERSNCSCRCSSSNSVG